MNQPRHNNGRFASTVKPTRVDAVDEWDEEEEHAPQNRSICAIKNSVNALGLILRETADPLAPSTAAHLTLILTSLDDVKKELEEAFEAEQNTQARVCGLQQDNKSLRRQIARLVEAEQNTQARVCGLQQDNKSLRRQIARLEEEAQHLQQNCQDLREKGAAERAEDIENAAAQVKEDCEKTNEMIQQMVAKLHITLISNLKNVR